ncbi:hypothetical protein cyc_06564 [Cyclospora cayetanensis]|uniref:Uncharacterized protein n=1 Tax=Cyclospora cayetanensis TaxID=88456 RepID=A0A1D3D3E1_9EIME|nr:hypothetical protein cyc_06564 [Cyclospora cayetanensis]
MSQPVRFRIEPTTVGDGRLLRFLTEQHPPQPSWEAPPMRPLPEQQQHLQQLKHSPAAREVSEGTAGSVGTGCVAAPAASGVTTKSTSAAVVKATTGAASESGSNEERNNLREWLAQSAAEDLVAPPLDLLQKSGAFLMSVDEQQQQQQQEQSLLLRNEAVWAEAIQKRDRAAQRLAAGGMAIDMLLGLQQRYERAAKLHVAIADCRGSFTGRQGACASEQWLLLLQLLQQQQWETVKKQYQPLEFELGDGNYPYRAEVYIHLIHVASTCWGGNADLRSRLPLPPPPPFQEHFALLSATEPLDEKLRNHKDQAEQLHLQLEFPSPIGPLVESKSLLHCSVSLLLPLPDTEVRSVQQQNGCCCCCALKGSHAAAGCGAPTLARREAQAAAADAGASPSLSPHGSTCLPPLPELRPLLRADGASSSGESAVIDAAAEVYQHLEAAQWVLADLAAAHVLISQLLLQEGGVALACRHRASRENSSSWCGIQCASQCLSVEALQIAGDRVDLLIRNVPVYRKGGLAPECDHTHDLALSLAYVASGPPSSDATNSTTCSSNSLCNRCCSFSGLLLRQFERVVVLSLRQLFLDAWAAEAFDAPAAAADSNLISPPVLLLQQQLRHKFRLPSPQQCEQQKQHLPALKGMHLLRNFLNWLLTAVDQLMLPPTRPQAL